MRPTVRPPAIPRIAMTLEKLSHGPPSRCGRPPPFAQPIPPCPADTPTAMDGMDEDAVMDDENAAPQVGTSMRFKAA